MSFFLVALLSLLITLADLASAWLYLGNPEHWGIDAIRGLREGLMVLLALWGLRVAGRCGLPALFAALYAAGIVVYFLMFPDGADLGLVVASAAKLALPVLLVAAGYGCVDTPRRLVAYALLLAGIALVSTVFGAWDVRHTEFWTETLEYGHYLAGVKGIVTGFDTYYVLPFNFFGFEEARRAGGLVAAPLAQGSLVAMGGLLGFAALHRRAFLPAVAILVVALFGVWQSGTRGAMLILLIALPLFLIVGARGRALLRNVLILAAMIAGTFEAVHFVYQYSVNFEDGSTIGHLDALETNMADLGGVLVVGPGLGASGSVAADEGMELAGGGEGALFAIAYQMGVPAALVFLLFYGTALYQAFRARRLDGAAGDVALASFALGVGIVTTFISSDHLFSLSGMGVFWIMLGGVLAVRPHGGSDHP